MLLKCIAVIILQYIHIALCCVPITNAMLHGNYISIKQKKCSHIFQSFKKICHLAT